MGKQRYIDPELVNTHLDVLQADHPPLQDPRFRTIIQRFFYSPRIPHDKGDALAIIESLVASDVRRFWGKDGKTNYGHSRIDQLERIIAMNDIDLFSTTKTEIWHSAFANNNPHSDHHWIVDAIYCEWNARDKTEEYQRAYEETVAENRG